MSTLKLGLRHSNEFDVTKMKFSYFQALKVITFTLINVIAATQIAVRHSINHIVMVASFSLTLSGGKAETLSKLKVLCFELQTVDLASCGSASPGVSRSTCSPCLSGYSVPDINIISLSLFSALMFLDFWCVFGFVCSAC